MGSLRMALKRLNIDDDIIYNPLGLADHYLPKDFSDRELCFALASCDQIELFDEVKKFIYTDFSNYAKIVVWHGWSSDELLFLYLMSVLVEGNLYHVDIRDCGGIMAKKPETLLTEEKQVFLWHPVQIRCMDVIKTVQLHHLLQLQNYHLMMLRMVFQILFLLFRML